MNFKDSFNAIARLYTDDFKTCDMGLLMCAVEHRGNPRFKEVFNHVFQIYAKYLSQVGTESFWDRLVSEADRVDELLDHDQMYSNMMICVFNEIERLGDIRNV